MAPFAKLNGYQFETLLSAEIAPGETVYDQTMRLYSPVDFIDYGFTSLDELYVWFNILDENYDRYLIPEATVKLSEEASEYSHMKAGQSPMTRMVSMSLYGTQFPAMEKMQLYMYPI